MSLSLLLYSVAYTFMCLSPEVAKETFFLFTSGEWEAGCDTSSPLDKPGIIIKRATAIPCH